jgi:hypothetical protein
MLIGSKESMYLNIASIWGGAVASFGRKVAASHDFSQRRVLKVG